MLLIYYRRLTTWFILLKDVLSLNYIDAETEAILALLSKQITSNIESISKKHSTEIMKRITEDSIILNQKNDQISLELADSLKTYDKNLVDLNGRIAEIEKSHACIDQKIDQAFSSLNQRIDAMTSQFESALNVSKQHLALTAEKIQEDFATLNQKVNLIGLETALAIKISDNHFLETTERISDLKECVKDLIQMIQQEFASLNQTNSLLGEELAEATKVSRNHAIELTRRIGLFENNMEQKTILKKVPWWGGKER